MNIVHVRDTMKLLHKEGRIDSLRLHALLHAPVFVYDLAATDDAFRLNEEQYQWGEENLIGKDGRLRLPYPAFTLFAHSGADCLHFFVFGPEYPSTIGPGKKGRTFLYLVRYEKNTLARGSTCATAGFSGETDGASFWVNGEPIPTPSEEEVENQTRCCYSIIFRFCFDVMSNTNAVIRVSPKPSPGKSIEWQLARTHYCLLTKKQAMHVRDVRRPITDRDIQRAAHWRRAHFRRLTSERFTHKRGQLVPVAEAWVGPEEWIGLDGKIYKVINLTHPNR